MGEHENESASFFEHFDRGDKPTGAGRWLVKALARKVFGYVGVSKGNSILEIGPGRGDFADICLEAGLDYCAVEANAHMAESLQKRGASVIRAMVPPLPAQEKTFDAVVMINVMEHMSTMQDALQTAAQVRDVLKPGGRFLICSPDYLNWRKNFFNCDFSHNYVTTRRRLQQLLVNAGFINIKNCHLSGPMTGLLCFLVSAIVSRMPFALLNSAFPNSRLCYKLYKIQLTFMRKVMIVGEKSN